MTTLFTIWDKKEFYPTYLEIWLWHCSFAFPHSKNNNLQNNKTLLCFIHSATAVNSKLKTWTAIAMNTLQYKHLFSYYCRWKPSNLFSISIISVKEFVYQMFREMAWQRLSTQSFHSIQFLILFFDCFFFFKAYSKHLCLVSSQKKRFGLFTKKLGAKWYPESLSNPLHCL